MVTANWKLKAREGVKLINFIYKLAIWVLLPLHYIQPEKRGEKKVKSSWLRINLGTSSFNILRWKEAIFTKSFCLFHSN